MTTAVLKYDAACRAIAEAKTVDEVTDWIDKAAAVREYGRRIKDRRMELDAIEIRVIAKRRRGELLIGLKEAGQLAQGRKTSSENDVLTLEQLQITRNESSEEQKLAALPLDSFEALKARCRAYAEKHPEKHSFDVLEERRGEAQATNRRNLAGALADTSDQLLTGRVVPCIYIDPAFARKAGIGDRAYENHYPTESWDAILDIMRKARNRLQPNAWAFIWIPRAHMLALHPAKYEIKIDDGSVHDAVIKIPLIWAIARALGMTEYSTCFVWTKTDEAHPDEHGTFLVCRDQDEILCLYKKGDGLPRPAPEHIYGSNHRERSRPLGHSKKPPFYRRMIADMVGRDSAGKPLPVLELFCRHDASDPLPENWESWGNESVPEIRNEPTKPATNILENIPAEAVSSAASSDGAQGAHQSRPRRDVRETKRPATDVGAAPDPSETYSHLDEPPSLTGLSNAEADPDREAGLHGGSPGPADPEHQRWESEGGSIFPDADLVVIKRPAYRR